MQPYQVAEIAEWSVVVFAFASVTVLVGVGIGKVIALKHRVDMLEGWFGEVRWELLAKEQAEEFAAMRERMQDLENRRDASGDQPWWTGA